jgi:hypothetical protein
VPAKFHRDAIPVSFVARTSGGRRLEKLLAVSGLRLLRRELLCDHQVHLGSNQRGSAHKTAWIIRARDDLE